jgi:peptidase M48-like protein
MLFSDRLSEQEALEAKQAGRERLLEMLVADFRKTFPDLTFQVLLDSSMINAMASRLQDKRNVTVYGGLALHPRLAANSLAFILLHETGHHLAEGCRLVRDPALACECAADHWAATTGANLLQQRSGRCLRLDAAVQELSVIMTTRQKSNKRYARKHSTSACWAKTWTFRSTALLKQTRPPTNVGCCVAYA